MPTNIYTLKDNGDLKLMAEIEETLEDSEAVELLLENAPRTRAEEFIVISGTLDDGVVSTVSQKETVTIKWASSRNGGSAETEEVPAPSRRSRVTVDTDDEEEAPAPKRRRGRPPGSKNKPKTGTAARKTTTARKPAAKTSTRGGSRRGSSLSKGGTRSSSFKRNPASDE